MGWYTEIHVNCRIDKEDTPANVIKILKYLFDNPNYEKISLEELTLPEHNFFREERWKQIGHSCGGEDSICNMMKETGGSYYIISHSDIRKPLCEIEYFFDWIKPYVFLSSYNSRTFIGYYLNEEYSDPSPVFIEKDREGNRRLLSTPSERYFEQEYTNLIEDHKNGYYRQHY
jgi:hypothetical protein